MLLTGGASRRMGRDKASIEVEGRTLAERSAELLQLVCEPVIEVGPGVSGLVSVQDEPRFMGPLTALVAGTESLGRESTEQGIIVLAVDMPAVLPELLRLFASMSADQTVVPRVDGRPQSLCARYSRDALDEANRLVADGERSMMALLDRIEVHWLEGEELSRVAPQGTLLDLDRPEDLETFSTVTTAL